MLEVVISIATLLVLVIGFGWGVHVYNRQMNAQLFLTFTERFEGVMASFSEALDGDCPIDIFFSPPPPSAPLTAALVRYLNLCSEEFYMWHGGYLSRRIWRVWERELERTLTSPLVKREWPRIRTVYEAFPEFGAFVDRLHSSQSASSRHAA